VPRREPAPTPDRPVPTAGTITVRVRYCECDPMGVAHHAAYVPWFEMGRTELLRESGSTYAELERAGVLLAIVRLDARYRRPARYDDLLELTTRVAGSSRVKIEHEYELRLLERTDGTPNAPGELLATASTTLACIDRDGRPAPLPDWLAGNGRA